MRHLFGWSLPPGAAGDPNAPWNQEYGPCQVCGQAEDDCVCPECPVCGAYGDSHCYRPDNLDPPLVPRRLVPRGCATLTRSLGQVVLLAEAKRLDREEAEAEQKRLEWELEWEEAQEAEAERK